MSEYCSTLTNDAQEDQTEIRRPKNVHSSWSTTGEQEICKRFSSARQNVSDSLSFVLSPNQKNYYRKHMRLSHALWYSKVNWARSRKLLYSSWDVNESLDASKEGRRIWDLSKYNPGLHSLNSGQCSWTFLLDALCGQTSWPRATLTLLIRIKRRNNCI